MLDLAVRKVESKDHPVIHEPTIPTGVGKRKPDLRAQGDGVVCVVDVTITSDCNDIAVHMESKSLSWGSRVCLSGSLELAWNASPRLVKAAP